MQRKAGGIIPSSTKVPAHQREKQSFWYRGEDSRTSFNPDSSPQRAFVDYCLVFPKWMPHRRQAADKLTEHTSRYCCTLAKQKSKTKNKKVVSDVCSASNSGSVRSRKKHFCYALMMWSASWWVVTAQIFKVLCKIKPHSLRRIMQFNL